MNDTLYTIAIVLRETRKNLTITQGVVDLIASKMVDALVAENGYYPGDDFDPEVFLAVAGVRNV
jgi:translation initiation factor 2B subunit (eIF-2B alpha/beta/delta family)